MSDSCTSTLSVEEWTTLAKRHTERVAPFADAFLRRRKLGQTHAVHDFLFTYYNCSPSKLKQWVPSFDVSLVITPHIHHEYPWLNEYWFKWSGTSLSSNKERIHENVKRLAKFVTELCFNILQQPSRYGCYGLHEWAMVYKLSPDELRHKGYHLRLTHEELNEFVESQRICCSHYDAYRFFTKEALPLNTLNPILETRLQMEQGGCLHTNMDLYKWAIKLWPWIGSDFMAKVFSLALEGRELDMRASPYDLSHLGYSPICIETEVGRKEYQREQQQFAERSIPLRNELYAFCKRLVNS